MLTPIYTPATGRSKDDLPPSVQRQQVVLQWLKLLVEGDSTAEAQVELVAWLPDLLDPQFYTQIGLSLGCTNKQTVEISAKFFSSEWQTFTFNGSKNLSLRRQDKSSLSSI